MQPITDPNIEFWCFLSRGLIQSNNRKVGQISSVKYLRIAGYPKFGEVDDPYTMFIPNPDFKGALSMFQRSISLEYQMEYNLELARRTIYPNLPSRFSALFVFDHLDEAKKADAKYRWSQNSDLVRLRPVNPQVLCAYSRHDMEMVSMARGEWNIIGDDLDKMAKGYWEGLECKGVEYLGKVHPSTPIWEILFDGALEFVDKSPFALTPR